VQERGEAGTELNVNSCEWWRNRVGAQGFDLIPKPWLLFSIRLTCNDKLARNEVVSKHAMEKIRSISNIESDPSTLINSNSAANFVSWNESIERKPYTSPPPPPSPAA
jgi:hypothetical protein